MKIKLAENIKTLRKAKRLTQEALAEAMSVTVGAVSKWESGQSIPDISLLIELANYFEVSVDYLLGCSLLQTNMEKTKEEIRTLRQQKKLPEAIALADRALVKYPNSFDIVYEAAIAYALCGVEFQSQEACLKSVELHYRSLELISQNSNPNISEISIKRYIATLYTCCHQYEKAIELLSETNFNGDTDIDIGYAYATGIKDPDRALKHLSDGFLDWAFNSGFLMISGYAEAYTLKKDPKKATASLLWYQDLLHTLRTGEQEVTFLDSLEATLLTDIGILYLDHISEKKSVQYFTEAKKAAAKFSKAPIFTMDGIRFFHGLGSETAYSDTGSNPESGLLEHALRKTEKPEKLRKIWESIRAEG